MKTVAILDKILLTILLFSYSRLYIVFIQIYEIGHIYAKNQDIESHLGSYDVVYKSARFDTFMTALVSLDSILFKISCFII